MMDDERIYDEWMIADWIGDSDKRRMFYEKMGMPSFKDFLFNLRKNCYEYASKVDFNVNKLNRYATKIDISYDTLVRYIKEYAMSILGIDSLEWNLMINKEKNEQMLNEKITFSLVSRELYEMLGGGSYHDFYYRLIKYCYDYLVDSDYNYDEVIKFVDRWNIDIDSYFRYVKEYVMNDLELLSIVNMKINGILNIQKKKMVIEEQKFNLILRELEKADNIYRIKGLLMNIGNFDKIYNYIPRYVKCYESVNYQEKVIASLEKKIRMFKEDMNNDIYFEKRAFEIIKDYIDSNDNVKTYCEKKEINILLFRKLVLIVKNNDLELYNLYLLKIWRNKNRSYAIIMEKVNMIINGLRYGINDGRKVRPFEMEDYYEIFKMDINCLINVCRSFLSEDDLNILIKFVARNREKINNRKKKLVRYKKN